MNTVYELPEARPTLRDSGWAMALFGYTPERRSAFWQWIYANRVPHIRISAKRILFDERQVMDWLNKRNTQPKRK